MYTTCVRYLPPASTITSVVLSLVFGCEQESSASSESRNSIYIPEVPRLVRDTVITPVQARSQESVLAVAPARRIGFTVRTSFREAALQRLSAAQLDALDAILLGRLDVHALVPLGSEVSVWLTGDRVTAAEIGLVDGRRIRTARYDGAHAPPGWYDQEGLSLSSAILGRPVALSRITSTFGERLHPVTGTRSAHRGVDYGAALGTPVFAVGDGTILVQTNNSAAGNHIKIAHEPGFESWYLHLSNFAAFLIKGDMVKQGQVIAYVGATGMSTGPHLHYEVRVNDVPVDASNYILDE